MPSPRLLPALLLVLAATLATAPAASAARTQESIFQDDRVLLNPETRDRALDELRGLGIDTVRVLVVWRNVAPSPGANRRPSFDAADPAAYGDRFDRYDALVRGAAARGISVLLTPTSPAPDWASECSSTRSRCRPKPDEFGSFIRALGTRYSGDWPAPATPPGDPEPPMPIPLPLPRGAEPQAPAGPEPLPRVSTWSIWNEPNLSAWLSPQLVRRSGRRVNFAARRYRELFLAAVEGLRATGHADDRILLGETAPIGRIGATSPVPFLGEVFCLSARGRAYRGESARIRGCRRPAHLPATGVAHHPYTFAASAAPTFRGKSGDVTIASLGRLTRVLDTAARHGRVRRRLPVFLTEFGFQTNPPDFFSRTTPARQAAYINESELIAYRNRRVASTAQYQLVDEPDRASFNTGLRFSDWRPKPSLEAYALPLVVSRSGRSHVRVFGGVRPADPGAAERVRVQRSPRKGRRFRTVATLDVPASGYVTRRLRARGGRWRLAWKPAAGGPTRRSRVDTVR